MKCYYHVHKSSYVKTAHLPRIKDIASISKWGNIMFVWYWVCICLMNEALQNAGERKSCNFKTMLLRKGEEHQPWPTRDWRNWVIPRNYFTCKTDMISGASTHLRCQFPWHLIFIATLFARFCFLGWTVCGGCCCLLVTNIKVLINEVDDGGKTFLWFEKIFL